jgi:hypothetical protein
MIGPPVSSSCSAIHAYACACVSYVLMTHASARATRRTGQMRRAERTRAPASRLACESENLQAGRRHRRHQTTFDIRAACNASSLSRAAGSGRSRAGTSSASSGIWGRLSCAGWVVRVRVLRRALAPGDLKRLQRSQEFVSVLVHLGTGVDNVVTDNVPRPWVRVKVYRPLDPGVPPTLAVALHEAAVSCRRLRVAARIKYPIEHRSPVSTPAACESRTPRCKLRSKSGARS